jgi:dipeptidase D
VEVTGLSGGHSGLNIGENRGNAVKLLVRFLQAALGEGIPLELGHLAGGDKHNAIPREAEARILMDPSHTGRLQEVLDRMLKSFRGELKGIDEGLQISVSPADVDTEHLSAADRDRLLRLLAALPHGVLAMSNDLEGLVETSSNLAAVKNEDGGFLILTSSRSSIMSSLDAVLESIRSIGELAGAEVEIQVGYPGWKPNMDSAVLRVVKDVYTRLWDSPPEITAIHAGLECGLIGEKVPGMDMVSFGPQIRGAHSPDERVNVPSVGRFWNALREILRELASA